jgi:hypothetical protein
MTTDYISELDLTVAELNGVLKAFTAEEFKQIPFKGSWSAAQVAEHILKSVSGIPKVLSGNHTSAERDPEEKVKDIKTIFLDFTSKMKSPEFILPSDTTPAKEELLRHLNASFEKIRNVSNNVNLAERFTDFPFPQMGELTGYEWLCFVTCHTKRHIVQIKNIYGKVSGIVGVAG